jgi:nitroreductase
MNSQEVDIYVALPEGLFLYEAPPHRLRPIHGDDVRGKTGAFGKEAPLVLIFVADLPRLAKARPETRSFYAGFDAGCICQNIYLFCASEGLATVVHDLEREPLSQDMKLRPEQTIVFVQAVGYSGEAKAADHH